MISKLKVLGLALIALSALSAMAASAAQAGKFDIGTSPAVLTASNESGQETLLTITTAQGSGSAKCKASTLEGTTEGTTIEEATVTPTYGSGKGNPEEVQGCTLFGLKAQVLTNGCKFTVTGAGQPALTANVDIVGCTEGKKIEIINSGCVITIGQQGPLSKIVATNIAGEKEVTLAATVGGITTTQTGVGCLSNGQTAANGSFTGNYIAKAFKDNGPEQVTLHKHQYNKFLCGEQVKLVAT
jgi:hypothetical protein